MPKQMTTKRLLRKSRDLGKLAQRHETIDAAASDRQFQESARSLLNAAVKWREGAMVKNIERRSQDRPRPRFTDPPPDSDVPLKAGAYNNRILYWSSRYAWDVSDGLPQQEAIHRLLKTACVGLAIPPTKK